jgi:hypothetical protein
MSKTMEKRQARADAFAGVSRMMGVVSASCVLMALLFGATTGGMSRELDAILMILGLLVLSGLIIGVPLGIWAFRLGQKRVAVIGIALCALSFFAYRIIAGQFVSPS